MCMEFIRIFIEYIYILYTTILNSLNTKVLVIIPLLANDSAYCFTLYTIRCLIFHFKLIFFEKFIILWR